jgi:hypothetical protein
VHVHYLSKRLSRMTRGDHLCSHGRKYITCVSHIKWIHSDNKIWMNVFPKSLASNCTLVHERPCYFKDLCLAKLLVVQRPSWNREHCVSIPDSNVWGTQNISHTAHICSWYLWPCIKLLLNGVCWWRGGKCSLSDHRIDWRLPFNDERDDTSAYLKPRKAKFRIL